MRKKNLAKRITAIALASAMSISLPGIENIPYMYDSSSVVQAAESTEDSEPSITMSFNKDVTSYKGYAWTYYGNEDNNLKNISKKENIKLKADISLTVEEYKKLDNGSTLKLHSAINGKVPEDAEGSGWTQAEANISNFELKENIYTKSVEVSGFDNTKTSSLTGINNIGFWIEATGLKENVEAKISNIKLYSGADTNPIYEGTGEHSVTLVPNCINVPIGNDVLKAETNFTMTLDISITNDTYTKWENKPLKIQVYVKDSKNGWKEYNGKVNNTTIYELQKTNFSESPLKQTISFAFSDIPEENQIGEIGFKVESEEPISINVSNVKLIGVSKTDSTNPDNPSVIKVTGWDFDNGVQDWQYDDSWKNGANISGSSEHDAVNGRLKVSLNYSKETDTKKKEWMQAGISLYNKGGFDFSAGNLFSFDFYYNPSKMNEGDICIKPTADSEQAGIKYDIFKAASPSINELTSSDDDKLSGFKKVTYKFSLNEDSVTKIQPEKIMLLIAGRNTDYNGDVYFDNMQLSKVEPETFKEWDFAQGIGNWKYNNIDWKNGDIDFTGSVDYDSAGQRLQANIDFSKLSDNSWAQVGGISYSNEGGLSFSDKNQLSFDFYYPASLSGNITIKPVAEYKKGDKTKNLFVGDQSQSISGLVSEDAGNGLKKATFEFVLDENNTEEALPNQLLLVLIGNSTNCKGAVYFDNIKVETIDRGYKYSTIQPDETKTTLSTTDKVLTINDETKTYIDNIKLVDDKANDETKALYQYLKAVGESSSVIYGHMEDTVLKAGNDSDEFKDSDTADVTDSISAIDGLDCGALFDGFAKKYVDRYGEENSERVVVTDNTFEDDVKAAAAFSNKSIERGAIMTLSSHLPNFAHAKLKSNADSFTKSYDKYDYTGGDSYKLTGDCMNNILPGGKFNDAYTSYLDLIAEYAKQVNGPILFRPLHENTGSWFWWGKAFCDAETYKSVFKYTVDYLRDEKNVHNFLYLYGPGSEAASEEEYEERYPGDNYVDMVGFDSYDAKPTNDEKYVFMKNFENTVKLTNSFAQKHNKLFAVTETGISNDSLGLLPKGNPRKDWYKEILDIVTKADYNCCYFMLWSNYSSTSSYYTPFVVKKDDNGLYGHELLDKFIEFFNDKRTIFACHQKGIIESLKTITKPIVADKELDGYIIEPVANSRILNETTISAKFNMETDKTILIRASGNEKNIELKTVKDATGKVYTATLTKENLNALGKTADGKIGLYVDGKLYQEISVILNIEEKVMLPEQVDDFESYGGLANLLLGKWATNKDSGCTVDFSLVNDLCYEGEYALKFAYNETKTGWAGATISKEADWSAYDALKFWVKPDGKNQKTVIQINASEGTYEAYLNLYPEYANASTPLLVTLPFSEFKKNNGDVLTSEALKNMSGFGLWVNAIGDSAAFANGEETVSGELYYDDIRAVSAGTDKPIFEIAEGKKPEDTTTEVKENETEIKNNIGEASLSKTDFKNIQEDIKNDVVTALKDMLNNASIEDKEKVRKAIDAIESGQAFIDISLKVNEKSSDITDEDEKKENNIQIEDIRNEVQRNNNGSDVEVKVAVTLDISLFSICKDKKDNTEIARVALSKLTKPVKISMKLPANIPVVKNGVVRTYYIICLHKNKNGKIESSKVKCDYDKNSGMISFDGSKFSTYVLCYADITSKSTNTPSSGGSTISGGGTSVVLGSVTQTPVPTSTPTAAPSNTASPAPSVTVTPTPVPSSTPSSTNTPSVTGKPSQTEQPSDEPSTSPSKVKKGTKFITKGITYRVTSVSGTKTVTCVNGKKNIKKAVVPASVKINGKKYKVTVIAKNAFKDNKKLTKVTIGKNIQSIGKNAFKGCKNLKKIIVKTKKLTAKKVGSNAFKGINSKAVVKVPKNKVKAYKKIIKAKGAGKKVKVIK